MMWSALLAARSPPLFNRCPVVLPDEAGTGLTPHRAAKLASDLRRSGLSPAVRNNCVALFMPTPLRAINSGAKSVTIEVVLQNWTAC